MWVAGKATGWLAAFGAMLALAVALTACGGSGSESAPSAKKDTLKIGVENIPTTLDPGQAFQRTQYSIMRLITGTLTNQDPEGKELSMGLAESVTPGDDRYVVKLKPHLRFSDGSALTAADVVASFNYYLADDTNGYGYTFTPIKKVTATDDLTVNFELKRAYPSLPYFLAQPQTAIVPSESIEAMGKGLYKGDPLPTAGQFQVESFAKTQITLRANRNYAGRKPSAKTLVFKMIPDPAARLAQVQGGELDFADTISAKQVGRVSAPVEIRANTSVIGEYFLSLNNRDNALLSDVRIRQAIGAAIDRNQINEVAFAGLSKPVLSLWANSSQYSAPFLSADPDVARAKQLLAGTKCATGCTLRLISHADNEALSDTAIVVQQNLQAIGIKAVIATAEAGTLNKWSDEGNFDIRVGGAYDVADFPDGYLAFAIDPDFGASYSGYSSEEMNRLIDQVFVSSGSARTAAVDHINSLFEKDLPLVPTVEFAVVSASRLPEEAFNVGRTLYYNVG